MDINWIYYAKQSRNQSIHSLTHGLLLLATKNGTFDTLNQVLGEALQRQRLRSRNGDLRGGVEVDLRLHIDSRIKDRLSRAFTEAVHRADTEGVRIDRQIGVLIAGAVVEAGD